MAWDPTAGIPSRPPNWGARRVRACLARRWSSPWARRLPCCATSSPSNLRGWHRHIEGRQLTASLPLPGARPSDAAIRFPKVRFACPATAFCRRESSRVARAKTGYPDRLDDGGFRSDCLTGNHAGQSGRVHDGTQRGERGGRVGPKIRTPVDPAPRHLRCVGIRGRSTKMTHPGLATSVGTRAGGERPRAWRSGEKQTRF
jgi:hypothetical protein